MSAPELSEAIVAFTEHEHRDLRSGLVAIHEAACLIETHGATVNARLVRGVRAWATAVLEPHLAWEETWLYPQIESITGTPWSTRAARFDHGQIRSALAQLQTDEHTAAGDLRCRLFALEALLRAHVEREELLLEPVLLQPVAAAHPDR